MHKKSIIPWQTSILGKRRRIGVDESSFQTAFHFQDFFSFSLCHCQTSIIPVSF